VQENFPSVEDSDGILARFNRLMRDLETGNTCRNSFRPWEVELLVDFDTCEIGPSNRRRLIRRYRTAVERELSRGALRPLKLSEYLARTRAKAVRALS
jgi:hypothetical protein